MKTKLWKGLGIMAMIGTMAATMTACGNANAPDETWVSDPVQVYTTVTPGGQYPYKITAKLDEAALGNVKSEEVSAEAFAFSGKASGWMNAALEEFSAPVEGASLEGDTLTLTFSEFPKKYFYVDSWMVSNRENAMLNFYSGQVTNVFTPVADDFETFTQEDGEDFTYHLFTPAETEEPQPLVIVFHGFSDTWNLLTYRTSIAWAEPEAQAKRPCYVLSPVIPDEEYFTGDGRAAVFEAVYAKVQSMIEAGQVDPKRVVVMGNSFGGMSTIEFCEKYPDVPAGAMALCSALNYSDTAMTNLEAITEIPLRIYHAENDSTISSSTSKEMYQKLVDAGDTKVEMHIFSDEEMNAVGGSSDSNSTYSYHHVELAIMDEEPYLEWLYNQVKE